MCLKKGLSNPKTGLLSGQMSVANTMRPGEEVVLFGENPPVDEIAGKIGTINYEVVCAVGKRVPRIYVQ